MALQQTHNVLKVTDLSVGYAGNKSHTVVAQGLSFACTHGQLIGLVGANGIGKSTLLRTLSGMQKKLSGDILINQKPLDAYHPQELAKQVSIVLTESPTSKNLTVQEFVSLGRQPYTHWMGKLTHTDWQKVQWAMESTEILPIAQRKCFELSDGQFQRVAIARTLAQDTPLILMDEPTTHLDLYHRAYVLKLLKRLTQETQKTIIFSTHEIDLAIQLSNQVMVLTPSGFHVDTPKALIADGHFTSLFPADTILFDHGTGRFTIKE